MGAAEPTLGWGAPPPVACIAPTAGWHRTPAARCWGRAIPHEDVELFFEVLLAGYEADGTVAAFIRAEHRILTVRRYLLLDGVTPVAAAAMTVHRDVAVLGGASTLRAHRGQGAQTRLLQHRLRVAAAAGCTLAVATALPRSVSAANLARAGFEIHPRAAWASA